MVLAGNSVEREDFSSLSWEEGNMEEEHAMVCVDGLCSLR